MDCTGTFEMATAVQKHKMFTCIHKYYSVEDWLSFKTALQLSDSLDVLNYVAVSSGSKEEDYQKLQSILKVILKLILFVWMWRMVTPNILFHLLCVLD